MVAVRLTGYDFKINKDILIYLLLINNINIYFFFGPKTLSKLTKEKYINMVNTQFIIKDSLS